MITSLLVNPEAQAGLQSVIPHAVRLLNSHQLQWTLSNLLKAAYMLVSLASGTRPAVKEAGGRKEVVPSS